MNNLNFIDNVRFPELFRFQNRALNADKTDISNSRPDAIQKACDDMESLFWFYMIKAMRETIPESNLFPKSNSHRLYDAMLDSRLSELMAQNGGVSEMMSAHLGELTAYRDNAAFSDGKD